MSYEERGQWVYLIANVLGFGAYAPVVLLGAPVGWPPGTNILAVLTWPVINQLVSGGGGRERAGNLVLRIRAGHARPRISRLASR